MKRHRSGLNKKAKRKLKEDLVKDLKGGQKRPAVVSPGLAMFKK